MRDFTPGSYQLLLKSFLHKGYQFCDLAGFLAGPPQKAIFLRHDIDRYTSRVEQFARLENSLGIRSTFYFRPPHAPGHRKMIEAVVQNNHHLGYHYNDLAEHHGNVPAALQGFSDTLAGLRTFGEVKDICMHGNVLSSINNLDLLKYVDLGEYGLTGDPYVAIDHNKVLYLTDTSRCWNCNRYNKWDRVQSNLAYHPASTAAIVAGLAEGSLPDKLHLCIHPQHYYGNRLKWTVYHLGQSVKNRIKSRFIPHDHA